MYSILKNMSEYVLFYMSHVLVLLTIVLLSQRQFSTLVDNKVLFYSSILMIVVGGQK